MLAVGSFRWTRWSHCCSLQGRTHRGHVSHVYLDMQMPFSLPLPSNSSLLSMAKRWQKVASHWKNTDIMKVPLTEKRQKEKKKTNKQTEEIVLDVCVLCFSVWSICISANTNFHCQCYLSVLGFCFQWQIFILKPKFTDTVLAPYCGGCPLVSLLSTVDL